jgi:anti-anti-sigma factor
MDQQGVFFAIVEDDGDRAVVRLVGEMDMAAEERWSVALADARALSRTVEVDLSHVTFIDSSGLRCLLAARQRAEAESEDLTLVSASDAVRRLVELSGLSDLLVASD